jgi:hypothetical protein
MRYMIHKAKISILMSGRLLLRGGVVIDLNPAVAAVVLPVVMVLFLVHPNLTHERIMHIKQSVSLQQHLEPFPNPSILSLTPGADEGCC